MGSFAVVGFAFTRAPGWLEFAADRYSARLGYDLREALKHMDRENKGNPDPDPIVSLCKLSHPSTVQRVAALTPLVHADARGGAVKQEGKKEQ